MQREDGAGVVLLAACRARDLHVRDAQAVLAQELKHVLQAVLVRILHVQVDLGHIIQNAVLEAREHQLGQEHEHAYRDAALIEAAAEGKTDDRARPETGRRGQSLDALTARHNDRTGADEADTGNDLRAETGHIGEIVHIQIQILTGHRGERCAEADEDMRAETGGTALERALQTDHAAAQHGETKTHRDR